jgi:hypothetical protein
METNWHISNNLLFLHTRFPLFLKSSPFWFKFKSSSHYLYFAIHYILISNFSLLYSFSLLL